MPVDFATPASAAPGWSVISVKRAHHVETTEALTGHSADETDSALRDRPWIQAVGIALHQGDTGHVDDVGFAAGEGQNALSSVGRLHCEAIRRPVHQRTLNWAVTKNRQAA